MKGLSQSQRIFAEPYRVFHSGSHPHRRDCSGEGGKLSFSVYTSRTNWTRPPTQTAWWRTHNSTSSTSGGWKNLACHLKHSQTFRDAQLRASCITTWYGNCSALNCKAHQTVVRSAKASPGANYLPSRTPTAPNITGSPKRSSRTTTTQATACSLRYHPEGEVSTGASGVVGTERLKNSFYLKAIRLLDSDH